MMKKMNKVIAAMMMMAITTAMPAMAGNKHHNDKNGKVVAVDNKKETHFDKVDKALSHKSVDKKHAYRPDTKTYTFKVSRHDSHKTVAAKAERMKGVMDTKWNPRTRELTVIYDANVTSARHIKHFMA